MDLPVVRVIRVPQIDNDEAAIVLDIDASHRVAWVREDVPPEEAAAFITEALRACVVAGGVRRPRRVRRPRAV